MAGKNSFEAQLPVIIPEIQFISINHQIKIYRTGIAFTGSFSIPVQRR